MLTEFETVWNGHLGWVIAGQHGIKLSSSNTHPIALAPYQAVPKKRELENIETTGLLKL